MSKPGAISGLLFLSVRWEGLEEVIFWVPSNEEWSWSGEVRSSEWRILWVWGHYPEKGRGQAAVEPGPGADPVSHFAPGHWWPSNESFLSALRKAIWKSPCVSVQTQGYGQNKLRGAVVCWPFCWSQNDRLSRKDRSHLKRRWRWAGPSEDWFPIQGKGRFQSRKSDSFKCIDLGDLLWQFTLKLGARYLYFSVRIKFERVPGSVILCTHTVGSQ